MKIKGKILIVDDDEMTREIIANVLTNAGYEVFKAGDSMEAIHSLNTEKPGMVLLDIILPDMNGLELLNLIRFQHLAGDEIPVILISQLSKPEVMNAAMKLGANDMIIKPFDPAILVKKISKYNIN